MADSLARELLEAGCSVVLCRDRRAGPAPPGVETVEMRGTRPPWRQWAQSLAGSGLLWPVAPETGGAMAALARLGRNSGIPVMASEAESLRVAASKRRTAAVLGRAGVPVIPTAPLGLPWPRSGQGWVIKPDDGAGAEGVRRVRGPGVPDPAWPGLVVQPYVPGRPLSLGLLCAGGRMRLLACNRQLVRERSCGRLVFEGVEVGGAEARRDALEPLARAVAAAMPGLFGPVGVDIVDGEAGPVVVEVNARITTAWPGLAAALGRPGSPLALDLLHGGLAAVPALSCRRTVTIRPEASHD